MMMKTQFGFISPQFIVFSSRVSLVFYDRKKELHVLKQAVERVFPLKVNWLSTNYFTTAWTLENNFLLSFTFLFEHKTLISNQCFVIIIYKPSFFPFIQ